MRVANISSCCIIVRVFDQNGVSLQWYIVKNYNSGRKPSICSPSLS